MNPQRQNRHEAVGQSLDLVAGEEVDGKVALGAVVVPDRQAGPSAPGQHRVGVLDLGADGVRSAVLCPLSPWRQALLLEHQPHVEQVPKFTVSPPQVLRVQSFVGKAELPIQSDGGVVMGKDAQCQLVQPTSFCPLDCGRY